MNQTLINTIIQWGPTIFLLVNVLLAVIFGLLRGFRKNLILAIQALVAFGVCVIVFFILVDAESFNTSLYNIVNWCTNTFMGQSINSLLGISEEASTIKDIITHFILLSTADEGMASVITLLTKDYGVYLLALVNGAYRLVLALVLSILYGLLLLIFYIIYSLVYPERRHKNKVEIKYSLMEKPEKPYKKRRALGALVGGVRGIITSIFLLSIIGSLLYIVSGDTNTEEADFGNNEINGYYNIYQSVADYDDYGIYKVLGQIKNQDNVPYYLFIADTILSGRATEINSAGEEVSSSFVLREEFTTYTRFTKRTLNLVLKYASADLNAFINNPSDEARNQFMIAIANLFSNEEFNKEFSNIISDFGDSFIMNFAVAGIDAFASNLEYFNLGDYGIEDELTLGLVNVVFTGENRIKVSDLLTKDDAISVFNALLSVLANVEYSLDGSTLYIDPLSNLVSTSQTLVDCLCELSIFNDPNKVAKFNLLFADIFEYLEESWTVIETPEEDTTTVSTLCAVANRSLSEINWVNEVKSLLQIIPSGIVIYESVPYSDDPNVMLDAIFELFSGEKKEENLKAYDTIVDILSRSEIIGTLLTFDPVYEVVFGALEESAGGELVLPEINYSNTYDSEGNIISYGETYYLLTTLKLFINAEGKEMYTEIISMNTPESEVQMGTFALKALNYINKKDEDGTSIASQISQSKLLVGVLSNYIQAFTFDLEEVSYGVYLPSGTYDEISNSNGTTVKLIKSSNLVDVIEGVIPLVEQFEDLLNTGFEGLQPTDLLTQENLEQFLTIIEKSAIVEATLANIFIGTLTTNELITLPKELMIPEGWLKQGEESGELVKIINLFLDLNIDITSLINLDMNYLLNEILTEENTTKLFTSDVLYLAVSSLICDYEAYDTEGVEVFAIVVPKSSMVRTNYTDDLNEPLYAIDKSEIIKTVNAVKQIASIGESELTINYNNIFTKENGEYTVLATDVIYATIVYVVSNTLQNIKAEGSEEPLIVIPELLANAGTKEELISNSSYQNDFKNNPWKQTNELTSLLDAIDILLEVSTTENFDFTDSAALSTKITNNIIKLNDKVSETSNETKLDVVYNSQVIKSTLTKSLPNLAPIVVIPEDALGEDGYITKAELSTLLDIVGDLIPENGSINDISFDDLVITKELRDKIVSSTVLAATLTNYLKVTDETTEDDIQNMIVVPVTTNTLVYGHLTKTELTNLFDSFAILVGDSEGNIRIADLSSLDANKLLNLTDDQINTITSSEVISYSLTSILSTTEITEGASIIVPDTALTSDEVVDINGKAARAINTEELKGLFSSLKSIIKEDATGNLTVDIVSVFEQKDNIIDNDVLHATIISFFVSTFGDGETIAIPDSLIEDGSKDNLKSSFSSCLWVVNSELNKLMTSLDLILEISGSESFAFDDTITDKLMTALLTLNEVAYPNTDNTDTKLDVLYQSEILKKTLTTTLPAKVEMIVIPDDALGLDGYITINELENLFNLAPKLVKEGESLLQASADNLDLSVENKDLIVSSNIILATITKYLKSADSSIVSLIIPSVSEVYDTVNAHVTSTEMDNLLSTLITLFGENSKLTEIQFSFAKLQSLEEQDIEKMNQSQIMRYTITNYLKSDNGVISVIIPTDALDPAVQDINGKTVRAAKETELNGVIKTITSILPIDDPNTPNVDESTQIDIKLVFEKKDDIIANNILHPTVISYMIKQLGSQVSIPTALITAGNDNVLANDFSSNIWATTNELSNLFDALDMLFNITSSSDFDFNNINVEDSIVNMNQEVSTETDETKLDIAYKSLIIQKTFTDTLNNTSMVNIPGAAYSLNDFVNELYINVNELKNLFDLLGTSKISDFDASNIDLDSITRTIALDNATILRTLVSDGILDTLNETSSSGTSIKDEINRYDESINVVPVNTLGVTNTTFRVLTQDEIIGIVSGIKSILGLAETDSLLVSSIDVSNISLSSSTVGTIVDNSRTLARVISRSIISSVQTVLSECYDNTDGGLVIGSTSPMYNKYLSKEEIVNLFAALEAVTGRNEIAVNDISMTNITISSSSINTLLESRLAYLLVSNQLKTLFNLTTSNLFGIWDTSIKETDNLDVILDTEIANFFASAFIVLGVNSISLADGVSVENGSISTSNIADILKSYIIWNEITQTIDTKIDVPSRAYEDANTVSNNSFIAINEISSIISILGTEEEGSTDKTLSLSASFAFDSLSSEKVQPMADSYIIRYKMSETIIGSSTGNSPSIYIPSSLIQNESNTSITENYIIKSEFINLLNALISLNVSDISSFSIGVPSDTSSLSTMFNSMIIRATMTNLLDVNDYTEYFISEDLEMTTEMLVLKSEELTRIIDAINVLSTSGNFNITINLATILTLSNEDRETLLASNTIRIAVSDMLSTLIENNSTLATAVSLNNITKTLENVYYYQIASGSTVKSIENNQEYGVYSKTSINSIISLLSQIPTL